MKTLPILFNTEMVFAILDGRKTVTRRITKCDTDMDCIGRCIDGDKKDIGRMVFQSKSGCMSYVKPPYLPDDILYVRETWRLVDFDHIDGDWSANINYRADDEIGKRLHGLSPNEKIGWRPSIHMPKEAARIWLKVKDVRVERLQDMEWLDALAEGVNTQFDQDMKTGEYIFDDNPLDDFIKIWDSTIKKQDLDKYGWDSNPWVWVIEFERCEKPEEGL